MPDNEQIRHLIASCRKCDDHADLQDTARKIFGIIQNKEWASQQLKDAGESLSNWVADEHIGDAGVIMNDIEPEDGEPETVQRDAARATELYTEQEEKKNGFLDQILDSLTQGGNTL